VYDLRVTPDRRLYNLYSVLADSVESMSDDELLAEARERGIDPAKERDRLVDMMHAALDGHP
jgi:hypothetical protein